MTDFAAHADAYVCDISACSALRVAGDGARSFLSAMFTGDMRRCAELFSPAQGLLLTGQGEIVDVVLVVRTGDAEYMVLASPENGQEAFQWLEAHAGIEDKRGRVFGDVDVSDAGDKLAAMVMCGPGIERVHADLLAACEGRFAFIDCSFPEEKVYGVFDSPAYLLLVPANAASQIGDFLAAYLEVEALDLDEYRQRALDAGVFEPRVLDAAYVKPADVGLEYLVRPDGGFVGAKAL